MNIWEWLTLCRECGRVHEFLPGPDGKPTWKDPVDGHIYYPRQQSAWVERMRREYEEGEQ